YVSKVSRAGSFDVLRVANPWSEPTVTWSSQPGLGATVVAAVPVSSSAKDEFLSIDLTSLVKMWVDGTLPNYGVALVASAAGLSAEFDSKENENTSHEPRLEITL